MRIKILVRIFGLFLILATIGFSTIRASAFTEDSPQMTTKSQSAVRTDNIGVFQWKMRALCNATNRKWWLEPIKLDFVTKNCFQAAQNVRFFFLNAFQNQQVNGHQRLGTYTDYVRFSKNPYNGIQANHLVQPFEKGQIRIYPPRSATLISGQQQNSFMALVLYNDRSQPTWIKATTDPWANQR